MFVREGVNFGGKELSIETGRMAKQAMGRWWSATGTRWCW
jgi:polyribonucleotide nucleotidyltransferase